MMPDKIFINKHMLRKGMLYPAQKPADVPEFVYISKDFLLRNLNEQKKQTEELVKQHPEDDSLWAEMHWYEELIEKTNAL